MINLMLPPVVLWSSGCCDLDQVIEGLLRVPISFIEIYRGFMDFVAGL